ncbi:hypothetical protein FHW36_1011326 [Chitinophaga polysaccharea]|uniref:Uncharacterized protein n=1 Tax=Chitinophaga polysaccharea TaxID=1293035 RepID=A0A561Q4Y4_9BACT|nr:hypothetical protein [Chitinophaga polysaccharea]TWF45396.1 hypothetical protein FHW36_1011326 [Chitinophaga polysaccharea]
MRAFIILVVTLFIAISSSGQCLSLDGRQVQDTGYLLIHRGCKALVFLPVAQYAAQSDVVNVTAVRVRERKPLPPPPPRVPFLQVHGNVLYDFYYQSNVDTPYAERDIHQHTIQTNLSITVRNQYPLRLSFSTQAGNSSLFRNLTGIRLGYNNQDFKNQLINNARNWSMMKLRQRREMDTLQAYLDRLQEQMAGIRALTNTPSYIQRLIEARERALLARRDSLSPEIPVIDKADSLYRTMLAVEEKNKHTVDSLQQQWDKVQKRYMQLVVKADRLKANLMDVLRNSRNNKELSDALEAMNLPDSILPKGFRTLLAIRSFGIGRTMADYSELTAKNISITGVQVEYNPSYYLAVATGVVDYQFRNFIVREQRSPQYMTLVRAGLGMKEDNHLFLTYYTGKKQLYGSNATTGVETDNHLMGMALEGQWKLGEHTYLVAETAKSSLPYNVRKESKESNAGSMVNFSGHSNEAYTASFRTLIEKSGTRVNGMYKVMQHNFQSFSLYTTGSRQIAWNIQAEQPFFRQQVLVTGAIQRNSYATFYQPSNYAANTVFKSLQVSVRIPRWPVITLGYQPSSQLVKLNNEQFTEQVFYMLSGTGVYSYKYRGIMMNSMLTYSRFYNRQTDSQFVYFNSRNILASHTVFLDKFTLGGQASAALTQEYTLYGLTGEISWKSASWLELGGSLKYNRQTIYNIQQLGYGVHARINIPRVGELALQGDKNYLPGAGRQLVSNNTGRLTYTRIF